LLEYAQLTDAIQGFLMINKQKIYKPIIN